MNFRKIAAAAVSVALALALTACAQQDGSGSAGFGSGSDEYVLKVGEVQGALCHAPLQVAMRESSGSVLISAAPTFRRLSAPA